MRVDVLRGGAVHGVVATATGAVPRVLELLAEELVEVVGIVERGTCDDRPNLRGARLVATLEVRPFIRIGPRHGSAVPRWREIASRRFHSPVNLEVPAEHAVCVALNRTGRNRHRTLAHA